MRSKDILELITTKRESAYVDYKNYIDKYNSLSESEDFEECLKFKDKLMYLCITIQTYDDLIITINERDRKKEDNKNIWEGIK